MNMDQAAIFLAASILTSLGFIVVAAAVVAINNILHKYWKPVRIFTSDSWSAMDTPGRFVTPEDMKKIAPHLDTTVVDKKV